MADEPEDNEVLNLTEEDEVEQPEQQEEKPEGEQPEGEDDGEEVVVGFSDEQPEEDPDAGNKTVRQMREALREKERELRELRAQTAPKAVERRKKPDLWDDCDGDPETFEAELLKWNEENRAADAQEAEAQQAIQAREQAWQSRAQHYTQAKAAIGGDFTEAEDVIDQALGKERSPVFLLAKDPAALVLALSKSPTRLAELAKIKDPLELAVEVGRMEGMVKVERRKRTPAIDRPASGNASTTAASADATLKKLEEKASKTGDRSELIRYKKEKGLA